MKYILSLLLVVSQLTADAPALSSSNLLFSPLSFIQAMTYTYVGSAGETRAQLEPLVNPRHLSDQELINAMKERDTKLAPICKTATAFFVDEHLPIKATYLNLLPPGGCQSVNFQNASAALIKMNTWVKENSAGKIPELLHSDDVDASTVSLLISALHFKAAWLKPFFKDNNYQGVFHGPTADFQATYMQQEGWFQLGEDEEHIFVLLPYSSEGGAKYGMELLLPKENSAVGLSKLNKKAACLENKSTSQPLANQLLDLHLPKFVIKSRLDLKPVLEAMRITVPFTNAADFSQISTAPLKIQKVIQESVLEVNEEGSEGAAATAVSFALTSFRGEMAPRTVKFDRPFYLRIVEMTTGTEIFQATVREPNEQ